MCCSETKISAVAANGLFVNVDNSQVETYSVPSSLERRPVEALVIHMFDRIHSFNDGSYGQIDASDRPKIVV